MNLGTLGLVSSRARTCRILKTGKPYIELGVDYFNNLDAARVERHHVRRLEQLGYTVTLTPLAA